MALAQRLGLSLEDIAEGVKHVLTHRILMADCYLAEVSSKPQLPDDYIWIPESAIDQYGVPRLVEKLLTEVAALG